MLVAMVTMDTFPYVLEIHIMFLIGQMNKFSKITCNAVSLLSYCGFQLRCSITKYDHILTVVKFGEQSLDELNVHHTK